MKVIVSEAGWGGNDYPGGAHVTVTTDDDKTICVLDVQDDIFNSAGRYQVRLSAIDAQVQVVQ